MCGKAINAWNKNFLEYKKGENKWMKRIINNDCE